MKNILQGQKTGRGAKKLGGGAIAPLAPPSPP